ncbi:hypothetical protein [Sphingomonas sp. VNH70]|uniref:hypothetical protein n=1 Tax=Sphingomonas silueang TaxID=3156617 RepID=UPI0032B445ED
MDNDTKGFDDKALDSLAVAPDGSEAGAGIPGRGDAAQDADVTDRVEANPGSADARLDEGLNESMDASDPISATQRPEQNDPAPSSGYDAEAEAARARHD